MKQLAWFRLSTQIIPTKIKYDADSFEIFDIDDMKKEIRKICIDLVNINEPDISIYIDDAEDTEALGVDLPLREVQANFNVGLTSANPFIVRYVKNKFENEIPSDYIIKISL